MNPIAYKINIRMDEYLAMEKPYIAGKANAYR